jgi:hypothetical protein
MATQVATQSLTQAAHSLAIPTSGQSDSKLQEMSFIELDAAIDHELIRNSEKLIPYLREMRGRFDGFQGTRNDLHPDTPEIGWQKWVKEKKDKLGSLSKVNRLLRVEKKPGRKKPRPLTALESRLIGTCTAAHEAMTDIEAGRIEQGLAHLRQQTPTPERISEFMSRRTQNNPPKKPDPQVKRLQSKLDEIREQAEGKIGELEAERDRLKAQLGDPNETKFRETRERLAQNHRLHLNALGNQLAEMVLGARKSDAHTTSIGLAERIVELYRESRQPGFFEAKAKQELASLAAAAQPKLKKSGKRNKKVEADAKPEPEKSKEGL